MQETDFPFEIIIHDDASTDGTSDIVREYAKKYPNIIRPIIQEENQYSKIGVHFFLTPFMECKGEFIAICEGDDYWLYPNKLQEQIGEMCKHEKCNISFHSAVAKYADGSNRDKMICSYGRGVIPYSASEVILGDGKFMPTSSIVFRRTILDSLWQFFRYESECPIGDYYVQVIGALEDGALYIDSAMSVYRVNVTGSLTHGLKASSESIIAWARKKMRSLDDLDRVTQYDYTDEFGRMKKKLLRQLLRSQSVSAEEKKLFALSRKELLGTLDRILWVLVYRHNWLLNVLRVLARRVQR